MKLSNIKRILFKKNKRTQNKSKNTSEIHRTNISGKKGFQPYFMSSKELREFNNRYSDPTAYKNVILGEDVKMSIDTKKTRRNSNTIVIGGSGSGKTYHFVRPNINQMNGSMVIIDPNGELLRTEGKKLLENGYKLEIFSTMDPKHSGCYNPLDYIYEPSGEIDEIRVSEIVNVIMANLVDTNGFRTADPFWLNAAVALLRFSIMYLAEFAPEYERDLYHVLKLIQMAKKDEDSVSNKTELDTLVKAAREKNPEAKCFICYDTFSLAPAKTANSIVISLSIAMSVFANEDIKNLTSTAYECNFTTEGEFITYVKDKKGRLIRTNENIGIEKLGDEKTALFICVPTANNVYNALVALLISQTLSILYDRVEKYGRERYAIYDNNGDVISSQYDSEEAAQLVKSLYQSAVIRKIAEDGNESNISFEKSETEVSKIGDRYYIYNPDCPSAYSLRGHWNGYLKEVYSPKVGELLIERYKKDSFVKHQGFGLPVHVTFMMDEFCNIGYMPEIGNKIATSRKYGISYNVILQNINQIKALYPNKWEQILGCCDYGVFLSPSEKDISDNISYKYPSILNPESIIQLSNEDELVMVHAEKPILCKKYDYKKHPKYDADSVLSEEYIHKRFVCSEKGYAEV